MCPQPWLCRQPRAGCAPSPHHPPSPAKGGKLGGRGAGGAMARHLLPGAPRLHGAALGGVCSGAAPKSDLRLRAIDFKGGALNPFLALKWSDSGPPTSGQVRWGRYRFRGSGSPCSRGRAGPKKAHFCQNSKFDPRSIQGAPRIPPARLVTWRSQVCLFRSLLSLCLFLLVV